MSGKNTIFKTPDAKCFGCGKKKELRPYGPYGEDICVPCASKDKETTERRMSQYLFGERLN